jgi:hypothetical protein
VAFTILLALIIGIAVVERSDGGPNATEVELTGNNDRIDEALDNVNSEPQGLFSDPNCPQPSLLDDPMLGEFESEVPTRVDAAVLFWEVLKRTCTASSPGFPAFLYEIPVGTIVRDPDNGRSLLITLQGWKHIPTGGDFLCFQNQGHPVLNLAGVTGYTMGMDAGDIACVVPPQSTPAPAPSPAPPPTATPVPAPSPAPAPAPPPPPTPPPPPPTPPPPPPPPPQTWSETTGGPTHTWTNYTNAGGTEGPTIPTNATVQIACKLQGFRVEDGNTWWYRIASSPWNSVYYASADAFYNNGQTSGSLHGTPFVDPAVPDC